LTTKVNSGPRANVVYKPFDVTTLHAGYARYFTPPPVENVPSGNVNVFDKTSNESLAGPNAPEQSRQSRAFGLL